MELFDVIAVNLETHKIRILAVNKTHRNAEAIEDMAVLRNGCDEEFFTIVSTGKYQEGDTWKGNLEDE